MKAQEAIMGNSTSHIKEANFVKNKYVFWFNNNLAMHYHPMLWNHENLKSSNYPTCFSSIKCF